MMMRFDRKHIIIITLLLMIPAFSIIAGSQHKVHQNRSLLPKECGSCHRGHGKPGTPLLNLSEEDSCLECHGGPPGLAEMVKEKRITSAAKPKNIDAQFSKPYRHPIEVDGVHVMGEPLPETNPVVKRHAECVDCHNPHATKRLAPPLQPRGYKRRESTMEDISFEYELCFKCHGLSANLPFNRENIQEKMRASSISYHPVLAQGKGLDVPSLLNPYTAQSLINCTDCHGSDEPGAPRGPHGSIYEGLLVENFTLRDGSAESLSQYHLCYQCHSRKSIMNNESFRYHAEHVSKASISCYSCHDPHGSFDYTSLIRFNPLRSNINVSPSTSGRLEYRKTGKFAGECYLTCHGKDHDPLVYP